MNVQFSQFNCSVMSDPLWPHGLQHTRLPCPSPTPGACLNSWPLSQWCHRTISSSVIPFSPCLQSFPASGSFPIFRVDLFQDWLVWSPCPSKGLSRIFSSTIVWNHQFFVTQPSSWSNFHIHTWLVEKPQLWLDRPLSVSKAMYF